LLQHYPSVLQSIIYESRFFLKKPKYADDVYKRSAFNEFGDAVSHLDKKSAAKIQLMDMFREKPPVFNSKAVDILNEFNAFAERKKARVYFTYPAVPSGQYVSSISIIMRFDAILRKKLKISIVGAPEDFVLPPEYFFDTIYHLKREGIVIRTKKLISVLRGPLGYGSAKQESESKIVMLGDSLTFGGYWPALLKRDDVYNRGVGGDTSSGVP
jgi:hypothetical protein